MEEPTKPVGIGSKFKQLGWQGWLAIIALFVSIVFHIMSVLLLTYQPAPFVTQYLLAMLAAGVALALSNWRVVTLLAFFFLLAGGTEAMRYNSLSLAERSVFERSLIELQAIKTTKNSPEEIRQVRDFAAETWKAARLAGRGLPYKKPVLKPATQPTTQP